MNQGEKQSILIVDDRPKNLLALESLLESPDLNIVQATSGNEALGCMLEVDFALVLLDVQMPDMNGFETAELMRGNEKTRDVPIIFVTAITKEEKYVFKGYEVGAVDYLFKPLDPDILKSKVNAFLELHIKTTELKQVTKELRTKNQEIDEHREKLQVALDEISSLILKVAKEECLGIRFNNPNLQKCYDVMNCAQKDCPSYGKEAKRCWQLSGTYCLNKLQKTFSNKFENCSDCPVFKNAVSDPIYQIGENFNNMMQILEAKNSDLEKAYTELKATQATILQQEKMASIGQLAAGVAHEINNPIGFVSSNLGTLGKYLKRLTDFIHSQSKVIESLASSEAAENLKKEEKDLKLDYIIEDTKELIQESLEGTERVKKIVQNLKSFSRMDGKEYKHADINECIESTINIIWNELKYKAKVRKEYGDLPLTKCYPQQLNQVFMNLLVNAAQSIPKQGEITIKTWLEDGVILASVSDTGSGIPEENLNRIFEPFFTTKETGKGTGLGLSILYDIVKKHNGEIAVSSEVDKGTIFTLQIPVVEGR